MKGIKELNKSKLPIIRIDKSLDKYQDLILFHEKVEKANEALKDIGLPKIQNKKTSRPLKTSAHSNKSPKSQNKN